MLGNGYNATRADTVFCGNGGPLPKPRVPCALEVPLQPEWGESFFFFHLKQSKGVFYSAV